MLNNLQKSLPELPSETVRSCMSAVQRDAGFRPYPSLRDLLFRFSVFSFRLDFGIPGVLPTQECWWWIARFGSSWQTDRMRRPSPPFRRLE